MKKFLSVILSLCITTTALISIPISALAADKSDVKITDSAVLSEDTKDYDKEIEALLKGTENQNPENKIATFSLNPVQTYSEITSGKCGANVKWSLNNGVLTISGNGAMYDYTTYDSYNPAPWAYDVEEITSIVINNGVTYIGSCAFSYCYNAEKVEFAASVTSIGMGAFCYCDSLTSLTLPSNIKTIDKISFAECINLKTVTTNGLTTVPYLAFYNCESLETVNLNEGVKSIDQAAFYGYSSLAAVTLPKSVTYVHPFAFPEETVITCKNTNMRKFGTNGYRYLQDVSITGNRYYDYAYSVLNLVNQERQRNGLPTLAMNKTLLDDAMKRAGELAVCFATTRPDSSSCFEINDIVIAENIAFGYSSPSDVMANWMDNDVNRINILNRDITTIGVGCFEIDGRLYWVQCFGYGGDTAKFAKPSNSKTTQIISLATDKFNKAVFGATADDNAANTTFAYSFYTTLGNTDIKTTKTTTAKLYVRNAAYTAISVPVNNTGITWSSSSTKVATVDSKGKVTGKGKGSATIKAKLKYFSASSKVNVTKSAQKMKYTASYTKTYGDKAFNLNAKLTTGNGKLTYSTSNNKVATVSIKGKVTIKGTGKCTITVKAAETAAYNSLSQKVTITVNPKSTTVSSVTAGKKKFTVKWKKQATQTTGYQIQYSTDKNFKKNNKTVTVSGNKTTSKAVSSLSANKTYYVRVRTYKTIKFNGKNVQVYSSWSKSKTVKTK